MNAVTIPIHRLRPSKPHARTRSSRLRERPRRLLRELDLVREVEPLAWLQVVERDDMTDPELTTVERECVPAGQTV